jgi:hypothetical protein
MPKLLFILISLGLFSCSTEKKFSGNYVCHDSGTNFTKLIFHFTSDSTVQWISTGAFGDSISGMYGVTDNIVHVKFKHDELYSKARFSDSVPIIYLFPYYSTDTAWLNIVLKIKNHQLMGLSYSPYDKNGFTLTNYTHFNTYHKWYVFKKEEPSNPLFSTN